jgi:transcriptional regulator with XRE-family HTH domain
MSANRKRKAGRTAQYRTAHYRGLVALLARNLRRIRSGLGLSQEEIAHRCGMSTRVYIRVEHGETNWTATTLARLAAGLDVDAHKLLEVPPRDDRGERTERRSPPRR